jgi:transcription antitermination factor NusG
MGNKEWYIISTQGMGPRAILKIQSILDTLDYEGELWTPMVRVAGTTTGRIKDSEKLLFQGYVFLHTIINDSKLEQALMEAKIGKFLKLPHDDDHDLPTPIKQEEIDHIKELEMANAAPTPEEIIDIIVGNLVEICVGPLIGFKGIVMKISGHSASIDTLIFGRSTPVTVNLSHLTKLADSIPQ